MADGMHTHAGNGGFPEPPGDELQRLVRVRHEVCGAETRVRLPRAVPARAIRRVVCGACQASYECEEAEEIGLLAPSEALAQSSPAPFAALGLESPAAESPSRSIGLPQLPRPRLPRVELPTLDSRAWRWASIA